MNRLYYNGDQPGTSIEFSEDLLFDVLSDIYSSKGGKPGTFSRGLFNEVRSRMSRAVDKGVEDTPEAPDAFKRALRHSGDVFAAFKVHRAQRDMAAQLLDSKGNLKSFEQWSNDVLPIASHQFGPWLRTEYNTAVLRARQAADWQRFEEHKDILPNLRWVPSTSANPGADHMVYWGTVLPVDHQFWSSHHPGDRWNCKCALEATDEPAKGVPLDENPDAAPNPGLDDNPGKSRRLFSDSHPYFPSDFSSCPFNSGIKNKIRTLFTARKKDCCNCRIINKKMRTNSPTEQSNDGYTPIPTKRGSVRIHSEHGDNEAIPNKAIATYLAEKYNQDIDLLPNINNEKSADSYNKTRGIFQEYKENNKPTKSAIDNELRSAASQAKHIVININSDIDFTDLTRGVKGRVSQSSIEELIIIRNGKDLVLSRNQILSRGFQIQQEDFK